MTDLLTSLTNYSSDVFFHHLIPYLTIKDVHSLFCLNTYYHDLITRNLEFIEKTLIYDIKEYRVDDPYIEIYPLLQGLEKNYVILGGQALRNYTNADWRSNDIDIYFYNDLSSEDFKSICREFYSKLSKEWEVTSFDPLVDDHFESCEHGFIEFHYPKTSSEEIHCVKRIKREYKNIQFINTRYQSREDLIRDFDLLICAIGYIIRNQKYYYYKPSDEIKKAIQSRSVIVYGSEYLWNQNIVPPSISNIAKDAFTFRSRLEKYTKRGYVITCKPVNLAPSGVLTLDEKNINKSKYIPFYKVH